MNPRLGYSMVRLVNQQTLVHEGLYDTRESEDQDGMMSLMDLD